MSNNGTNKFTIDCPVCKQRFSTEPPNAEIVNTLRASMVVTTHEKPIRCICGAHFVPIVHRYQLAWTILQITDEQAAQMKGSDIVVAPNISNLKLH